mmetsp:Transcript_78707/g.222626  ORF Transcript_78707/g.222626 Transcript_78707/m.222626 type:complete len:231 (-) Transcript_78707:95-787(-)
MWGGHPRARPHVPVPHQGLGADGRRGRRRAPPPRGGRGGEHRGHGREPGGAGGLRAPARPEEGREALRLRVRDVHARAPGLRLEVLRGLPQGRDGQHPGRAPAGGRPPPGAPGALQDPGGGHEDAHVEHGRRAAHGGRVLERESDGDVDMPGRKLDAECAVPRARGQRLFAHVLTAREMLQYGREQLDEFGGRGCCGQPRCRLKCPSPDLAHSTAEPEAKLASYFFKKHL